MKLAGNQGASGRSATGPLRGPIAIALLASAVLSCASNLLYLATPIYTMQIVDRVLSSGSLDTLLYLTILAMAAMAVMAFVDATRLQITARVGSWLERQLGTRALRTSIAPPSALADARITASFVRGPGMAALVDLPWTVVFLAALWLIHPDFCLLALGGIVALSLFTLLGDLLERRGQAAEHAARSELAGIAHSIEHELDLAAAMGIGDHLRARADGLLDTALAAERRMRLRHDTLAGLGKFVRYGLQIGITGAGALLVLRQEISSGAMLAASIVLGRTLAPVDQLLGAWRTLIDARAAMRRLGTAAPLPPPPGFAAPPARPAQLSLESVVVPLAPGRPPLLDRLTFTVEAGTCLGVLGPSGAGKSSLCRLLTGALVPSFGEVRLGGLEMRQLTAEQRRTLVGYLPQSPTLFPGTIAENIAAMAPSFDEAAVVDAAQLAGVHELILKLPQGYGTRLGFQGAPLSGGERQRIALARAVYGRPLLIVMDEPNAALDQDGEEALAKAIAALKADGRIVIAVAHRAAFLSVASRLLVLENGRLADLGPNEEVMARMQLRRRELRLDSRVEESGRISRWLEVQLGTAELGGALPALEVALVELFVHRVRHGFDGRRGGTVLIRMARDGGRVSCLVLDQGRPVGPQQLEESLRLLDFDPTATEELPESGLELAVARAAVDDLRIEHQGGTNRITIRKDLGLAARREAA